MIVIPPTPVGMYNVTERGLIERILGVPKYVACSEAASLDALHWANPNSSQSNAEVRRLYNVGQHTANGGRTTAQIRAAISIRYGHTPGIVASMADALEALRAGNVLTVAGDYGNLGTHFARWDLPFARRKPGPNLHRVCVGPIEPNPGTDPRVWWRDPLGPPSNASSYTGEWALWSMVEAFNTCSETGPGDVMTFPKGIWTA